MIEFLLRAGRSRWAPAAALAGGSVLVATLLALMFPGEDESAFGKRRSALGDGSVQREVLPPAAPPVPPPLEAASEGASARTVVPTPSPTRDPGALVDSFFPPTPNVELPPPLPEDPPPPEPPPAVVPTVSRPTEPAPSNS